MRNNSSQRWAPGLREGRAEDHRGAPDSDEERGHMLADSSRAVVRESEEVEEVVGKRRGGGDGSREEGQTMGTTRV